MKLKDLLKGLDYKREGESIDISNIVVDSRLVQRGDLFVAISGTEGDGHGFIEEALRRGAAAVLLEKDIDTGDITKIKVDDTRKASAQLAKNLYRDPSKDIKVIGITGTNGKTTVSYLLESILRAAGLRVGVIGTIRYKIGDEVMEAGNTTPSPLILQGLIREMVDRSLDYCIMEVSSHALDQERTVHIGFDIALFTNATREHLDYHKTFTDYLDSKIKLFRGLDRDKVAILNRDDPNFNRVRQNTSSKKLVSFGVTDGADICAGDIKLSMEGSSLVVRTRDNAIPIKSSLIGMHNIYNIVAACSCAVMEGIDPDAIKKGIENMRLIPGRLQLIEAPCNIKLFVDYAHTDDALQKVLLALQGFKRNRIITLFGCGGNRDREKRPRMGAVAARFSDYVIITSDNPRYEDPHQIANEVVKGIDQSFKNFKVIIDRRDAIREVLREAQDNDTVLLAGKGHEKYQIVKQKKIPFDDVKVAKELLRTKARCLV